MSNKLENNIYGVLGIEVINGNLNAGFDKYPKTDGNGILKASCLSLKYPIKLLMVKQNHAVLGIKSLDDKGNCQKQTDRYVSIFGKFDKKTVIKNLFSCKDILNFGQVYASESIAIRGIVQLQDAINKYENSNVIVEKTGTQYASGEGKGGTTLGDRYLVDEAHYFSSFSIVSNSYDEFINDKTGFEGYNEEDYEYFKDTSLKAQTLYNSLSKKGCNNEFGLFVKTKASENYNLALGDLSQYIKTYKNDEGVLIYDVTELDTLLHDCADKIESVEIYYKTKNILKGFENSSLNIKKFNIITRKEI